MQYKVTYVSGFDRNIKSRIINAANSQHAMDIVSADCISVKTVISAMEVKDSDLLAFKHYF